MKFIWDPLNYAGFHSLFCGIHSLLYPTVVLNSVLTSVLHARLCSIQFDGWAMLLLFTMTVVDN